jgi:hypothetical protein
MQRALQMQRPLHVEKPYNRDRIHNTRRKALYKRLNVHSFPFPKSSHSAGEDNN